MRTHLLTLLLLGTLLNLPAQTSSPMLLLKTDARAIILQPKVSFELFFNNKVSIEAGAGHGWTSEPIYMDWLGNRYGYTLLGIGPSKSQDIFSDVKFHFPNGFYIGLGYMYRYSHFENKRFTYELSEYKYQYYTQTESAYLNTGRITIGTFMTSKNGRFGLNPYLAIMVGNANVSFSIDTIGASSYENYSPGIFPKNEKASLTFPIIEIGCKFYFSIINRRDD